MNQTTLSISSWTYCQADSYSIVSKKETATSPRLKCGSACMAWLLGWLICTKGESCIVTLSLKTLCWGIRYRCSLWLSISDWQQTLMSRSIFSLDAEPQAMWRLRSLLLRRQDMSILSAISFRLELFSTSFWLGSLFSRAPSMTKSIGTTKRWNLCYRASDIRA